MRVLLTGSAGFIGSAIRRRLEDAGHDVTSVDLLVPQAHGVSALHPSGTHRLDVREAASSSTWGSLLEGVDAVCHQAAIVGVERGASDLPVYASHNDLGTAALLAAMATESVRRLVLASSMVVYGDGRYTCQVHGQQPAQPRRPADLDAGRFDVGCPQCGQPMTWIAIDETAPLRPRSGYAASKAAQEHYTDAWAHQTGSRAIALRYHNVYGPGMPQDTSYCGVAAMFRSALERGEAPRVFEDGAQARDFVHVEDVATANVLALEAIDDHPANELSAYNIASGTPVTIHEVAQTMIGGEASPLITGEYRAGDVRHIVASAKHAERRLGFRARIHPQTGLRELASAPLRARGLL